ncbi:1,4-alpha-glucan branching enzyme [Aquipluma nitroreducens]|uniref:1,4-alpha-glucan branching enzyme n=1 Tax=Aquipluma nitroreducens TaxID=2010828 RepID=A0A5K7SCG3_9BACT|nr:isoamylase early set domain-containing protein [Aquipluma nitroreducens]BBE19147.1 1,4-alpha-glucan branching enzyme [Aquipluma nitroreducens]
MSFKKQFLKSKPVCKVSFRLDAAEASGAKKVQLLGDFNNWDKSAEPMTALKSNDFTATLELEAGKEFQFRYLIDGTEWKNDSQADSFVANSFGEENSVVSTIA